ncbi:MAG: 7-carboxy-7-deazaguanine synthase QueE [Bacteroidetes bacterium]|jgi:7-carboxy-7-deazaguanine synthase|nr:7-carboxy-7-deazaguanine synthase QueE [Bacteroidota bacterium]MBU1579862.1 7-carboxy-7-deazaguanine synthase QueE [Bacteroidota bacterium]MBU2556909.1 7-carboxy-7-deazaguanine synthase QueE [Bacteroidota bacterium]MDA3945023.1 7-carboxy-7-deazaguanine synthase QueE [Bacteroidota bacterium]
MTITNNTNDLFEDGKKLPLMEEFYTIQGEGYNMGSAAYFIRIGGCDVGCHWCDTKPSWDATHFPPTAAADIAARAAASPAKTVVVTGGEPSMYPLDYFTGLLQELGIKTMVETSGAHPLSGTWNWICLSPKKLSPPKSAIYQKAHELKVVIEKEADLQWAESNAALVREDCLLYLQPEWSVSEKIMPWLTEYVMKHPQWRISLQSHKYMRIP